MVDIPTASKSGTARKSPQQKKETGKPQKRYAYRNVSVEEETPGIRNGRR